MRKFGSWTEQEDTVFRTTGDNKVYTLTPPSTLSGASMTLTFPDISGTSDTMVSRLSSDTGANRLQNKDLSTDNVLFVDNTDVTKKLALGLSGLSTATTRTLTVPDASDTLVLLAQAQTLTNKTIDGDDNTVQDLALSSLKTSGNLNVFLQRDGSGDVIDSLKSVPSGDVVGNSDSQTLTNKTIDADANTISNIDNNEIKASAAIALDKLAAVTASRALESDGSGFIVASTVTSAELGHLSGVTSAIQTQLDGKQADVITTRGDVVYGNASNNADRLPIGAVGTVLTSDGTDVSWASPAGTGDVTAAANIADNRIVRGDGGAKGIQQSNVSINDVGYMSGIEMTQWEGTVNATGSIGTGAVGFHPRPIIDTGTTLTVDSGAYMYSFDVTVDGTLIINGDYIVNA